MNPGHRKRKTDHSHPRDSALTFMIHVPSFATGAADPADLILPGVHTKPLSLCSSHYLAQWKGAGCRRGGAGYTNKNTPGFACRPN